MKSKIFFNGKISCMDKHHSQAEAMVVEDGVISYIGKLSDVENGAKPNSERINLNGRRVIPGLIDTHSHFTSAALSEANNTVKFVPETVQDILEYVKDLAGKLNDGEWIYLPNIYPTRIKDLRFPYLVELDQAAPNHPVFADGFYAGVANTLALKKTGLYQSDQLGVIRDEEGKPTGRVLGMRNEFQKAIPTARFTQEQEDQAYEDLNLAYLRCGITSVTEAMSSLSGIQGLKRALDKGKPYVRTVLTCVMNPDQPEPLLEMKKIASEYPEDFIKMIYGKQLIDGGILTGTSYMRKPYKGVKELFGYDFEDYHGTLSADFNKLVRSLEVCELNNLKFCAHATGNLSADLFLDVLQEYKAKTGRLSEGHALLHANFTDQKMLQRIKDLHVALLFQPAWHYKDSHAVVTFLDAEDFDTFLPYNDLYNSGIMCAAGSDHMIKHDRNQSQNPFNPFTAIYNMTTRMNQKGNVLGEQHKVDIEKALGFYTEKACFPGGGHENKGQLIVGKKADFACLSEDLLECPKEVIPEIVSVMTVVDGEIRLDAY